MPHTQNAAAGRAPDASFDRLTSSLFLGAFALALAALLALGPVEAMERLATVMRHLLPCWGR